MNEQAAKTDEYVEIDLQRIVTALWHKIWFVVLAAVLVAVITFVISFQIVPKKYQSTASFYVNNSEISLDAVDISSADISASRDLVASYIEILNSRDTLKLVKDRAHVDYSVNSLRNMINAESLNDTEIFEVVVTSTDKQEAYDICEAIVYWLPQRIDRIIKGAVSEIVDMPVDPEIYTISHSSPNYQKNTFIGFIVGFLLMAIVIILQEVFDVTIRSEEDLQQVCKHPVLASVPDMGAPSKGSYYYYGYGSKRRGTTKKTTAGHAQAPVLFGGNISFAASEAYKLLRTKLQFSFADESSSRVIGFSSALSGEGKSLSAINLAYTMSQLDKKVILIDCDMRRPTLAEKLGIRKLPGLSGYLTGQHTLEEMIQNCNLKNEETAFQVIAAGQNPPNPIELLSSDRMIRFLKHLREKYDYIILDLPPVGEVSDAMAVAKETDGMLLVVRQNYCDRVVLKEAVRQFDFIDAKILGVVYNCTTESSGRYGKGYYKRYYRRYYRSYYGRSYRRYEGTYMKKTAESGTEDKK
ncbi:MAG: polysaccharide biosynthesis tyrosine autokinase [Oscillospiraceae bacterium]|nr:polysaccharide biosynthesis tyrosine autokinase [Oscillospiraceae bacterium]